MASYFTGFCTFPDIAYKIVNENKSECPHSDQVKSPY